MSIRLTASLDLLGDVRNEAITALLKPLHEAFRSCTADAANSLCDHCTSMLLGIVVRHLCNFELWPLPEPRAPVTTSVERLGKMADAIFQKLQECQGHCSKGYYRHRCTPAQELEGRFKSLDVGLKGLLRRKISERCLEHFDSQAAKTGCEGFQG